MVSFSINNVEKPPKIPTLLIDTESAMKLAENPEFHKRVKHINRRYYYYRQ